MAVGGLEVSRMGKARTSRLWGIGVIAASVCCLWFGQSSGAAEQTGKIVGWGRQIVGVDLDEGFVAVVAGGFHTLGLKEDGTITARGGNSGGQCEVPSPNADFIAVAAGGAHSLGLKEDGSVVGWEWNEEGECDIPSPNTDFVAVSAGFGHSLGLKVDGSIVAWGWNYDGQCDIPLPNSGFIGISAGGRCSVVLQRVCGYVLAGDLTDDCEVDFDDFVVMCVNWLVDCYVEPVDGACAPK